jgi:hypothetical protein
VSTKREREQDKDVAKELEAFYQEVAIESAGPNRTMKMSWDDLGLSAEEQATINQVGSTGSFSLVHDKVRNHASASQQRARAFIERVAVYAGGRHLIPTEHLEEVAQQVEEEHQKYRWHLEYEMPIDDLQEEVKSWYRKHAAVMGQAHGSEVEERILQYAERRIPDRSEILKWDYALAVRAVHLNQESSNPLVAATSQRDVVTITRDIADRVTGTMLGICDSLAKCEDLPKALSRAQRTLRDSLRRCNQHNVFLGDPLVERACSTVKRMVESPHNVDEGDRRELRQLASEFEAQRLLSMELAGAGTLKPTPAKAVKEDRAVTASAAAEGSPQPNLLAMM